MSETISRGGSRTSVFVPGTKLTGGAFGGIGTVSSFLSGMRTSLFARLSGSCAPAVALSAPAIASVHSNVRNEDLSICMRLRLAMIERARMRPVIIAPEGPYCWNCAMNG
jgi:hypothetical protein